MLRPLLDSLAARPEVTGAAVISAEGLLIDDTLPAGTDGEALAALATTLLRQCSEFGAAARLGQATTAIVEFAGGPAILGAIEGGAALVVLARADADLGELFYVVRRHRPAVADAL